MPALTGDLYSMTRSASSGIRPFRLPSLKKDEDNETEQIMDQEQTDISLKPDQAQDDTQDGPLSSQAEPEAFDALMQRMDRLVNLARTFKGEDWMPTATEQQAIKTIFENSTDPDEAVGKFITALGVHDAMPQLSITDAYNSLDEISRFYSGKDYTAFDQSWLQKIKNGFTYMDIQNDMARWMELDLAGDPEAAGMEEQIRQKLEELGGLKSAIPTGWLDSVSDAVLENIGYMVVPSVQAAATAAVTKGALSTMISLFGLNPIAAASAGAVAGTVAAASGVATQFERIARGQTAQSYWDYMHDYEGSTPNKTSAQILAVTNGIFVGLTETFLDGVMSRAGGALLSKVAGKSVDRLGVNMLMNLDTSGSASRLGRAVFEWATGAVDEGFLNEFPQAVMDELMAAAYRSSIDLPADFDLGETFSKALDSAVSGLLVGAVYGTLSIPGAMQNDVITAAKLRRAANTSKNYQDFLYQTKDYKPEGVSEDAFEEARKAVWEKSESDKAELLKGSVLETVSIAKEELYNTFDEDGMDQAEVVPDGSVYRTDKGELYKETIENRDGSYTVYFGDRDTGAVYGSVDIDTDGSEISIKDVRVRYGYEGIRSEMVTDSIADIKTSELDVKWEPTTPGLQAVKQDIISANPNGPDSGLNYTPANSSELKGLEDSIRKAFPSFTPQQVKVSAVLYSLADSDKALSDVNQGQRFAPVSSMTAEELQGNSASSIRGAANKAKALIYTAENSDPSTFTHELFHVVSSVRTNESAGLSTAVRNTLDDETERANLRTFVESNLAIWNDGRTADDILSNLDKIAAGQKTWTAPVEEDLARLYEAYRASKSSINTNLPTGLKKVLERLADAIRRVYRAIREIVPVNREIASAFDRMMGISESSASNTKSAEARQSTDSQTRFQSNKTSDILYQTDSGAVSNIDGTLVITHELAEYKLEKIDELGGMPMPSLAISKPGISSDFGDIILVGSADLARKVIDRGYVYDRDIWSPMVPKPEYALTDRNRKMINRWLASTGAHVTLDNYYRHQYSDPEDISSLLSASEDIKKAYLKSKGIEIETPYKYRGEGIDESLKSKAVEYVSKHPVDYDNYGEYVKAVAEYIRPEVEKLIDSESKPIRKKILRNFYLDEKTKLDKLIEYAESPDEKIVDTAALSKIIEVKAPKQDVKEWVYKNIAPYYSEPFVTVGRKKYPYNIENVFRSMIHDSTVASAQNGSFTFNDGLARSYAARKLTSRAVIADNEYLLSQEESEELDKLHEDFRTEAAKRYAYPDSFEAFNDANRALGKYLASGHRTDEQLKKIFGSYDFSVDQTFIGMVNNLAESIDNMGRKYFEAKPAEIMQISDFSAALIPQGISENARGILAKSGIDVFTYSDKATAVNDYLKVANNDILFQKVTDPAEIARLEDDEKVRAYRAVQLIDGRIYSPMATVVDGRMVPDQQIGTWYRSDENPDLAIPDVYDKGPKKGQQKVDAEGNLKWKFKLEKGTKGPKGEKLSDVPAAYNPYWHSSASPLNDQFSSAYKRPNLAVVEVEIPKSDLDSGYRAYKAKDAVGPTKWHSGVVSTQLAKLGNPRTVYLSRYCKIVRIVPDSEIAAVIKDVMEGTGISIPDTLVTPSLKAELEKKGVAITYTDEVKDYYSDFDGDISKIELALTKKKAKQTADRLSGTLFQDALPEDIAVMDNFPVFDDYIEAGAMDAMQYEAMAEEAARIERELLGIDYTENYQAEDITEDDEPQGEDPFALDEEYIRRSPYRVVKGLDKDWLRSIGYEFIMDDNPGWTFREFAENNMPQVQYEGTDAQKDQIFLDALSDDINLRGYLSILGAAMLLDTTALNGGYEERYNPTYKRYERVAVEAPYTDQNYRLGLQQRVLKQVQSPAIVNAARYVLKNQSWPKNDKVRQAVLEELQSNPRAYRNLIASISGNESMKMESVADVDERRGLDIPSRESLDLMPVDELADLARRIRREDIARKIENGSLKMGGDADQSALDEVARVLKEQKQDLADREKEVKTLTEANTTLQEDVKKLDEAVGERDRILKEAESILESLRNATVTDAPHEIRDSLSSEEAELLSKKHYLTASESEYQKAATAKGSREKGKAIGARMGTANWLKDMEKFYPDIFVDENGNTLNSSVNKNTNEYKTIKKNIEAEIERINTRLNEITAERVSSLVRELGAAQGKVRSELAKLDKAAQASQAEEAKELGRQVKSLKKKNDRLAEKISDIRKDLSASKHEAKKLTAALEKARASVKAQRDELADDRKEIRSLSSKMTTLQKKLAKALEKAKSDIKNLRENVKRKQQEKRALQVIKDKKAALAREIMRPVNLKTTDFDTSAEAIMAIQALIDPAFRRDWVYDLKTDPEQKSGHETMTIDQAKAYFNSLDDAQRIDLMSYLDQSLIDRLTEQKKPLNDWTVEELKRLAEEVSDLRRRGQAVLSAKRGVEKDRTLQIQRAIISNLRKAGMAKKKGDDDGNIPGSLDPSRRERSLAAHYYKFRLMGLRMQEIAQLLDGGYGYKGQAYKLLVEDKRYHQNRRDRMIEKRMARVEPLLTPKAVENMCDRVTVNLGDISRDFTVDQLAYAWLSQRDDQNKAAVMYGSLLSAEEKGTSAGTEYDPETGDPLRKWLMDDKVIADDDELRAVATMRYSALLRSAEKELTSRGLMDLVEAISEDFNDPANAARLNRACIEAYNTPLDLREYYLAINRIDSNGKPLNDSFAANFFDPVTNSIPVNPEQGMRISRIEISPRHQTAVDMSLLNVWQNAVKTQEHLIEHASYVKQLHSVFNFYGSKEVVSAMDNAYGSALRREVASYIDLVSNPYKHEQSESINAVFRVLRQGLGAAYLGWKMSGIVLQAITSPFPGLIELSPARLAGAYLHIARHPVETIRFINEKSVMMKNRTMNMIIDEAQQRRNRWDRNKVQKAMDKFEEVGQIGLTMVDRYAVAGSWLGMYYKTLDEGLKSGMTTETADAAAVKAADDFILKTQPVGDPTELASMFRSKNEAVKAVLQFTTSLNVIWNNLTADMAGSMKSRNFSQVIGTVFGYAAAGVILGLVAEGFDDDEDRHIRKLIYWATTQGTGSVPLLGSTADYMVKKLLTGESGYTSSGSLFPGIDKLTQAVSALKADDWPKLAKKAAEAAALFSGLPYSGYKEAMLAIRNKSIEPLLGRR